MLEYGLLSYFLFKALSHRIQDHTIYATAILFVLFVGTIDEFLQWMMPRRYWDFRDVWLNTLAGGIFLLAIWKGIRPKIICKPVKKISVNILVGIMTVNLFFLGLCISNTPDSVKRYTAIFNALSWLHNEELMIEYGFEHEDPEIGAFYSRFTLEQLINIDHNNGESFAKILPKDISSEGMYEKLIEIYNPYTNPFLYEFLMHLFRRNSELNQLLGIDDPDEKILMSNIAFIAFSENLLLEKYFGNTLKHSNFTWPDEEVKELKKTASLWKGNYVSKTGKVITFFSLQEILLIMFITLIVVWISGGIWKRHLDI